MSRIRQHYPQEVEQKINEQINNELHNSYVYLSMAYYFDRDDIALGSVSRWLKQQSDDERGHAMGLMKFQNSRGGRVVLQDIKKPEKNEWGSALEAFEAALELEKGNSEQLLELHSIAAKNQDVLTTMFLEENYLKQEVEEIENLAKLITNFKIAGPSHGLYGECIMQHFSKLRKPDDPNTETGFSKTP